jgi:hypothetical protein
MPKRIQRQRIKDWRMPTDARYVGRPGYYGNPYKPGHVYLVGSSLPFPVPTQRSEGPCPMPDLVAVRCADVQQAVDWYRQWATISIEPRQLELLRGLDLACWCPPGQPCHADVLLEMANAPCRCMKSHAAVSPTHDGHCCFLPAETRCHLDEFLVWMADERALRGVHTLRAVAR